MVRLHLVIADIIRILTVLLGFTPIFYHPQPSHGWYMALCR
jgi:hypothetical protein